MANAKTKARLTKTLVNGLETREREYAVWDTECESFHVRVLSTGTKAFYVYYRDERGKQSRRSLGRANVVAVDAARKNAQSILADQRRGFDHFYELDKKLKIPTLSEFWPDYLEYHAIPKKSERSVVFLRVKPSACGILICVSDVRSTRVQNYQRLTFRNCRVTPAALAF
jgi:hypothetical protein